VIGRANQQEHRRRNTLGALPPVLRGARPRLGSGTPSTPLIAPDLAEHQRLCDETGQLVRVAAAKLIGPGAAKLIRSEGGQADRGQGPRVDTRKIAAMRMKRVEMDRLLEPVRLHRLGTGAREVVRLSR
jgi:hypothetical protein